MPTYYTLQIHYGGTKKPETLELTDLEFISGAGKTEFQWREDIQSRIYTRGFSIQKSPGTWELISPLQVNTAYLIKQESKLLV